MHLYKAQGRVRFWIIGLAAVSAAAVGLFWYGSVRAEKTSEAEGRKLLENMIERAVVSCYAIEGRYPASMEYVIKNYGVNVDTDRYVVTYEVFGDNIRPEVRVARIGEHT